jgi:uncharacterized MAPEG superfamily protein
VLIRATAAALIATIGCRRSRTGARANIAQVKNRHTRAMIAPADDGEKTASHELSHVLFGKPPSTFPGHAPGEENHMSTELKYLALTALLTASLWIPYVVAQVMTNGFLIPENYVDPKQRPLPFWGQRADRAYLNAVETFAPFAALILAVQIAGKADAMTAFWAISYFWLRVAHAVVYWAGFPYIRTLIFVLGWVCVVGLFIELLK